MGREADREERGRVGGERERMIYIYIYIEV